MPSVQCGVLHVLLGLLKAASLLAECISTEVNFSEEPFCNVSQGRSKLSHFPRDCQLNNCVMRFVSTVEMKWFEMVKPLCTVSMARHSQFVAGNSKRSAPEKIDIS